MRSLLVGVAASAVVLVYCSGGVTTSTGPAAQPSVPPGVTGTTAWRRRRRAHRFAVPDVLQPFTGFARVEARS